MGERLNFRYKENLDEQGILESLDELFGKYANGKLAGEGIGDFALRNQLVKV